MTTNKDLPVVIRLKMVVSRINAKKKYPCHGHLKHRLWGKIIQIGLCFIRIITKGRAKKMYTLNKETILKNIQNRSKNCSKQSNS